VAREQILLDHGSGGKISHHLVKDTFLPIFDNPLLAQMDDGAVMAFGGMRLAFSTDSYVVDPIFFPGGNIGDLAINGTVNDLAMCGAMAQFLSLSLIIEEGFLQSDLVKILESMQQAAKSAGVTVVTGDTKVVPKGAADKIFINTAGIGEVPEGIHVSSHSAQPGDLILLSGTIADHGMTILTQREGLTFDAPVFSDTAAVNHLVRQLMEAGSDLHVLRDPTRGGVGTALNEIAGQSKVGIRIYEDRIPVKKEVAGICELLGFDPLYVANEGKFIAFAAPAWAEKLLSIVQQDPLGQNACIIGEVTAEYPGRVILQTQIGGERIVDMLAGEQLPRIC
jgi:hydrogenase expression/formation protein HypE